MHFERHLQPVRLGGSALIKGSCWRSCLNKSESRAHMQKLALPDSFTQRLKALSTAGRLGMAEAMPPVFHAVITACLQHGQCVSSVNKYTRQRTHGMPRSIRRGPTFGAGLPSNAIFIAAPLF